MLANVNLGADLPILAHGGVVAVIGSRGTVEINPRDLMLREAAVVGVLGEAFAIFILIAMSSTFLLHTDALIVLVWFFFPCCRGVCRRAQRGFCRH
jgi:hypothetical protein